MRVPLGDASYDILLGTGLLSQLPELLRQYCPAPAYATITDSTVAPLYGQPIQDALRERCPSILLTFPAGEWNKSRDTWASLTDDLLGAHLSRDAVILAVGGGVTGDVAGFVAATYLRGIRYVQIPTSLLAMIDSSVGGKTGLDTPSGKNLVGAFHQPRLVVADIAALTTLPPVHIAAGVAEALKHGIIADADYFDRLVEDREAILKRDLNAMLPMVQRSVQLKAGVVGEDEREGGRRAILNFGHTIAHALEATTDYELLHGEAVAIGMRVEAELGRAIGVTETHLVERLIDTLEQFRLPTSPPEMSTPEALLDSMRRDKKVRAGTVRFALPQWIGKMAGSDTDGWTIGVKEADIIQVLKALA